MNWPNTRILDLFRIAVPILQAPMAGAGKSELAIAVSQAGGLGALPCAMLDAAQARAELTKIRAATANPIHVNFFCHAPPATDAGRDAAWQDRLAVYYEEFGLDVAVPPPQAARAPFDTATCGIVEEFRPEVVSFHFGLPESALLERVRATGAKIVASATTVDEARWLESRGCDAIIAQSVEAVQIGTAYLLCP
jgi:nitronate monooxygenase